MRSTDTASEAQPDPRTRRCVRPVEARTVIQPCVRTWPIARAIRPASKEADADRLPPREHGSVRSVRLTSPAAPPCAVDRCPGRAPDRPSPVQPRASGDCQVGRLYAADRCPDRARRSAWRPGERMPAASPRAFLHRSSPSLMPPLRDTAARMEASRFAACSCLHPRSHTTKRVQAMRRAKSRTRCRAPALQTTATRELPDTIAAFMA